MSFNKKVCHITSLHQRNDSRVFQKECLSLSKHYDVSLVVYDGKGNEKIEDVNVFDAYDESKDEAASRIKGLLVRPFKVLKVAKKINADIYHFHDPELIFISLYLRMRGKKVFYDIHENLPLQIMSKDWLPSVLRRPISILFTFLEYVCCRFFSGTFVPQPSMVTKYQKYNVNTNLVANFSNWSINWSCIDKGNNFRPVLFHGGSLSAERGLFNMLDLACLAKDSIELHLAGGFKSERVKEKAQQHPGWKYIKYLGVIDSNKVRECYQNSDFGIILYNNVGQYYLSYAIKLFEYMANGKPTIMPNFGEWISFNEQYQAGINVNVLEPKSILNEILNLFSDTSRYNMLAMNGAEAIENKLTWDSQVENLIKGYNFND